MNGHMTLEQKMRRFLSALLAFALALTSAGPVFAEGESDSASGLTDPATPTDLQALIDEKINNAESLDERLSITLSRNTTYAGDVSIAKASGKTYGTNFGIDLITDDAGEDSLSADGTANHKGNFLIDGINVMIKGLSFSGKVTVKDAVLDYFGTKTDDKLDIATESGATANIHTGAGNDAVTVANSDGEVTIDTGTGDDKVVATNGGDSGKVAIDTGAGDDTVEAVNTGAGTVTVETGDGSDTVTARDEGGKTEIKTGDGNDKVTATAQGSAELAIDTGDGDDKVALNSDGSAAKPRTGKATVKTGAGKDTVEVLAENAGAGITIDTGDDDDSVTIAGTGNAGGGDSGTISVDLGSGANDVSLNISVAGGTATVHVNANDGNDHIHITGTLTDDAAHPADPAAAGARASGTAASMTLWRKAGENETDPQQLTVETEGNVEALTDDLENKNTVKLTPSANGILNYEATQPFTNYVLTAPSKSLKNISIHPANGANVILSGVVIDTPTTVSGKNVLEISSGSTIDTRGLTLVLRARNIDIEGTLKADVIQIEALDGTGMYKRSFKDQFEAYKEVTPLPIAALSAGLDMLWGMVNISDEATITIGKNAKVYAKNDVIMLARVEQSGSIIDTSSIPDWVGDVADILGVTGNPLNIVNVKIGKAHINIDGEVVAGAEFDENGNFTGMGDHGSVRASAEVRTVTGYDKKGNEEAGFPIAVTVDYLDAAINVNGTVKAAQDIVMGARSEIKAATRADSGLFGAPFSVAVAVLLNNASVTVKGNMTANRGKVAITADGDLDARTVADKGSKQKLLSGGYAAVTVALQDVKADVATGAKISAKTTATVQSNAREKVENIASTSAVELNKAAAGDEKDSSSSKLGQLKTTAKDFLKEVVQGDLLPYIKEKVFTPDETAKEKLDKGMKRVASNDHGAQLDEDAQRHGEVTLVTNTNESTVTYGVTVKPWTGWKVKSVTWRGYSAGDDHFITGKASKASDTRYIVTPASGSKVAENVIISVEYEEDSSYEEPTAEDLFNEDQNDEDEELDLQKLIDDLNTDTDSEGEDPERALQELEDSIDIKLELKGDGGKVLTFDMENDGKCLQEVAAGDRIRLLLNPNDGMKLKQGGLKITWKTKETDEETGKEKEVTKSKTIQADDKGRFYFTVPEGIAEDSKGNKTLTVSAEYTSADNKDVEADETQNNGAGSIGVVVADNDSQAIIRAGAQVISGSKTDVLSAVTFNVSNTADGSAASKGTSGVVAQQAEEAKKVEAIKRPSTTQSTSYPDGAKYGVIIAETENGQVNGAKTTGTDGESEYVYRFTPVPYDGTGAGGAQYEVTSIQVTYAAGGEEKTETIQLTGDDRTNTDAIQAAADGKSFTIDFSKLGMDAGTFAKVSASFACDENGTTAAGQGQAESVVTGNPIKIITGATQGTGSNNTDTPMGTVTYQGVRTYNEGGTEKRYYTFKVTADTANGFALSTLKATWTGSSASKTLQANPDGTWSLDATDIPESATITVTATFKEDLHEFKVGTSIANGKIEKADEKIKAADKPQFAVTPNPGFSVGDIIITYKEGTTEKTVRLSDSDSGISKVDGKEGVYTFTVPANATGAFTVRAEFEAKSIGLSRGTVGDTDKTFNLSEPMAGKGDKVTVTLLPDAVKKGTKITGITVTDEDGNQVAEGSGDSFTIPKDCDKDKLIVKVTTAAKAIALAETKLDHGTVKPAIAKADPGDTVTMNVEPDKGYKVKKGTLKATVKGEDFEEEIPLNRKNDTTYTFVVPDGTPKNAKITFTGEFEAGQSDSSAMDTSVGIGIAVTVANSESRAEIKGGVTAGGAVTVKSTAEGQIKTSTKAGYSKGNIGIGGAVSVQVGSVDSKALIHSGAEVKLDGKLTVESGSAATFAVDADATGGKETKETGVGSGIAVAVDGSDSIAAVSDGAKVSTNAKTAIKGISVTATQKVTDTVSAKAGVSGGTSVAPVAVVDVASANAEAYMGRVDAANALTITEDVTVSATSDAKHTLTANASAAGKGAGVGAAINVSVVFDTANAKLNQSVKAANVKVSSAATSALSSTATASASGGKKDKEKKEDKSADKQADGLLGGASKLAGKNKSSGISGGKIQNASKDRQKAETTEGTVGVAGAINVNVQISKSVAEIADAVNVESANVLAVTSQNGTTSKVMANASTTNSDTGVGVGVAVNVVMLDNIARVGNGELKAGSLTVSATTKMTEPEKKEEKKEEKTPETKDELATELGQKVGEYVNTLVKEVGLDQVISSTLLGEIVNPIVTDTVDDLLKTTGLGDLLGSGGWSQKIDRVKSRLAEAVDGLLSLPDKLIGNFMDSMDDTFDLSGLGDTDLAGLKDTLLAKMKEILTRKLKGTGETGKKVLNSVKDGMVNYVKKNVGTILSGLFSAKAGDTLKNIIGEAEKEIVKAVKEEVKNLVSETLHEVLDETMSAIQTYIPVLSSENIDRAVRTFNRAKSAYDSASMDKILTDVSNSVTETFKSSVFDYEAMLDKIAKTNFKEKIVSTLKSALKTASVTLTNTVLSKLGDHFDLVLEAEEAKATGHVINTQAIAGAGARDVGIAGSVAITVLNADTSATIAESDKAITVSGDITVEANETTMVHNVASAAADATGAASANKAADSAGKDTAGGNEAGRKVSAGHVNMESAPGASLYIRPGDQGESKPKIFFTVQEGYKLPMDGDKAVVNYTYTKDGQEKTGTIKASKNSDGTWSVDPKSGDLSVLDADVDVTLKLTPEEVLHDIGTPEAWFDKGDDVEVLKDAVTVEVKDREKEDGKPVVARQGETVQIKISKADGRKVKTVGYSWTDTNGTNHDVEFNNEETAKEKAFTLVTNNETEYVYSFIMPDGEVTAILVTYEKGDEPEAVFDSKTSAKDESGKKVGVGASFSMVYGNNDAKATIGKRTISAAALTVTAASDHKEDVAGTAGTDPVGKENKEEAIMKTSVDASIALNILDNDIRAGIAAGSTVTATGDLTVLATEKSVTETTTSAFAVGGQTAVGATASINIAISKVAAEMAGSATVGGKATVLATSHSEDTTKALATAMGADIARSLNKLNKKADDIENQSNKLLDGSYVDEIGKEESKDGKKDEGKGKTDTGKKVNKRLDEQKGSDGKETVGGNSTSGNAMRAMGTKTQSGDAGKDGTNTAQKQIEDKVGQKVGVGNDQKEQNFQVAAAVGVTVAMHEAQTTIGKITAGTGIVIGAENTGNFNTMGSGAAMSFADHANSIAAGVAVSVNINKAKVSVSGDLTTTQGDLSVNSRLTQNLDGDFAGKLAAQALAGSASGKDSKISIGGAVTVVVSLAESVVEIAGGSSETSRVLKGDNITVTATDKSRLGARAGGLSISKGSSVGMGIGSAVVVSSNKVTAEIGDYTQIRGAALELRAEKEAVTGSDYNYAYGARGLVTDSSKLSDEQRKEADTGLIDIHKGDDDKNYKVNVNLSSDNLLRAADALNFLSGQNTYVEAIAGSVMSGEASESDGGSKLSLAGSIAVAVTNNTIRALLGQHADIELTANDNAKGDLNVAAKNAATTRIIAGSFSAAPAKASVGATIAVLVTDDDVKAETGKHLKADIDGSFRHIAETQADTQLFTAAMSVAAGKKVSTAAGGAINVIVARNKTQNIIGDNADITADGSAEIAGRTVQDLMAISGSASVVAGKGEGSTVAAGGTINVIVDSSKSLNTMGDGLKLTADGDVKIDSEVSDQLISGTAAISAAVSKDGQAGAGVINVIVSQSEAKTALNGTAEVTATKGDMEIRALNDAWMMNLSLSAAGATKEAVGAAFNVNVFNRDAVVEMNAGKLTAGGDLKVQSGGNDTSILAGLSASGSTSGSALSGNFIVLAESNRIRTNIASGVTATAGKNAILESKYSDFTVGAAGTVAISGGASGYGATVITAVKSNQVKTELGASTVTAAAGGASKTLGDFSVKGVYVGATAHEGQYYVGAGVAGGSDNAASGEIVVLVNNNTVLADASKTALNAKENSGSVTVTAKDDTRQLLLAGGISVAGSNAAGAAVVTLVSNKDVRAKAHDMHAQQDVNVSAENADDIAQLALSVGIGGSNAVQVGAAVQVLKSRAVATVGSTVTAEKGNFNLKADNDTHLINVAAALAGGGGAAVTPVGAVTYFQGEATAKLLTGSTVTATNGNINISTQANKDVNIDTVGFSIGSGAGLSGAANVLVSKDKAYAGAENGSTLKADSGSLNITAQGDYKLRAISGAVAGSSGVAVGVNAVVSVLKSNVTAELDADADVAKAVNVRATGTRDIINAAATLAAGEAAGGVTVMVLSAGTKMSQDAADMVAYGNSDSRDKKEGLDASKFMATAEKAGINMKIINADEADEDRQLSGDILAKDLEGNGHRESEQQVGSTEDGQSTFDGASGYRSEELDTQSNDTADENNRGENMEAEDTEDVANAKNMNTYTYTNDPNDAVIARITANADVTATSVTVEATQATAADLIGAAIGVGQVGGGISTVVAILHTNVSASSMGAIHDATGGVTVSAVSKSGRLSDDHNADERNDTVNDLLSNKPVSEDATEEEKEKAKAEKASTLKDLKEKLTSRAIRAFSVAVGAGQVGLGVAVSVVLTDNVTQAILGGTVEDAGNVTVSAEHTYGTVMAGTGSLAVGEIAAGVSVSVAQANGDVRALIAKDSKVTTGSGSDITVKSASKVSVDSIAVTAGAGLVAVNAGVALSFNRLKQETGIGGGSTIESGRNITVNASSDTTANSYLLGISVGAVGVSINAAVSDVAAIINTHIGDADDVDEEGKITANRGSTVTASGNISMKNTITSSAVPRVLSVAAGGVAVGGNVLLAFNDTKANATVENAKVKAANMNVVSDLSGTAESSLASVNIGAIAVGLSVNYADLHAENKASVVDSEVDLTGNLNILTGSGSNKTTARADTVSGNMGLITVGINAAIARNNTKNYAILSGSKKISVGGGLTVHGKGDSTTVATIKGFDLGVASVAVSAVVSLNDADTRSVVKVEDLDVTGIARFDATQTGDTQTKVTTGGGSLLSAKVSAAVSYGRTASLIQADIHGESNLGGISSTNTAGNSVSANIENGSIDIISAAARFAGAYSQDTFSTMIQLSGKKSEVGSKGVNILNKYAISANAEATPSTGGVDVSLASVAVNAAIAKSTAYADANFEAIKGVTHVAGDVTVKTIGTASTDAKIHTAKISIGGVALGANIAKADLSTRQSAVLRVGGTLNVDGKADVQSIANSALANAVIGTSGGEEGLKLSLANLDVSRAVSHENMESTAAVLGGPIGEAEDYEVLDKGQYVTTKVGHFDYEVKKSGWHVVRDEDGNVLHEAVTRYEYDTGEYEIRNALGETFESNLDPKNDGIRKLVGRPRARQGEMMRNDEEYFDWIEEEITEWVEKRVRVPIKVNVYNADENKLNAAGLTVISAVADGTHTGSTASTKGTRNVGFMTAGSLDAQAYSTDSFAVVFEGMTATITGSATLKAMTSTVADAAGKTPGGLTLVDASSSDVKAGVGKRGDKQTVSVIIGRGNTLIANSIDISAVNTGSATANMEQTTSYSLGSIKISSQPTESFYNTLISIGANATLKTTGGDLTITSTDAPEAISKVRSSNRGLLLNYNSMMGRNTVDQENNIDVGDGAKVISAGDLTITASQRTIANAETYVDGGGLLEGSTAKAQNTIKRVARVNVGEHASIETTGESKGMLTIQTISGVQDDVTTRAYVGSNGFVAMGNAKAYLTMKSYSEINIFEGATITSTKGITLDTRSTSYNDGGKDVDGNVNRSGIRTIAIVDSAALVPLPDSVARNDLSFNTYININQDEGTDVHTIHETATINAKGGDVLINASNDGLTVYAYAKSNGKGAGGVSNANAWNNATLTNAIWVDDAEISGNNIYMYAENGGEWKSTSANSKAHFISHTFAKLAGIGKVVSDARITGTMINQIRTYNVNNVKFTVPKGGRVIHKTSRPDNTIWQDAKADSKVTKVLGIKLAKDTKRKVLVWYYFNRCDFCGEGTEYDVRRTDQESLEKRYEDAFEKALSPINEIYSRVAHYGTISKARYGEEDYKAAGSIFVLDVKSILEKDVTMARNQLDKYRLWTNAATQKNVYLLPNSTRLYSNAGLKLQYVVDTMRGDVLLNGEMHDIDFITALTPYAFSHPIMPVGSTGSLDFSSGLLVLPALADFELYLDEVSAEWLRDKLDSGFLRWLRADQGGVNDCALEGADLPTGTVVEGITEDGTMVTGSEEDGTLQTWRRYWLGHTPAEAEDPDEILLCILVNEETDEIDVFRTSVSMLETDEPYVDVSLLLYRDSKSDRMEEEKYNVLFFDTPEGQKSLVKIVTDVMGDRTLETPRTLRMTLRAIELPGADLPAWALSGHYFAMCDGTDGGVSMFYGAYENTFDGDVFESDRVRIEGIRDGVMNVTIKKDQPVWPEWTGDSTAEDIGGTRFVNNQGVWEEVPEEDPLKGETPES